MGAISSPSSLPVLRRYLDHPDRAVRETCEIAVAKIEWDNSEEGLKHKKTIVEEIPYDFLNPAILILLLIFPADSTLQSILHPPALGFCLANQNPRLCQPRMSPLYEKY